MSYPGYRQQNQPDRRSEAPSSSLGFQGWDLNGMIRNAFSNIDVNGWLRNTFGDPGLGSGGRNAPNVDINSWARRTLPNLGVGSGGRNAPTTDLNNWLRGISPWSEPMSERGPSRVEGIGGISRAGPQVQNTSALYQGSDAVQDFWQEQYDRFVASQQAQEDMVKAQYRPALEGAEDDLSDLRAAAAAVGVPFDEYMRDRAKIGGKLDKVDPMTGSIQPAVTKVYDDASAEIKKVMGNINSNFGPEVTAQISDKVREFEATFEDVIRTDETAIDALHEKSGQYAQALAQAAYSNDVYGAIAAETAINAELDFKIKETQEEIERQKRAMADAIKAAQAANAAQWQWEEPEFEKVVGATWDEYFEKNGVPQHQRTAAIGVFNQIYGNPGNVNDEASWRRGVNEYFNTAALASVGITADQIEEWAGVNPDILVKLRSADWVSLARKGQIGSLSMELSKVDKNMATQVMARLTRQADDLQSASDPTGQHLRNMYTQRNTVSQEWDSIVANFGPKIDESALYRAPNGFTFPVVGGAKYSDSYGAPRGGGTRSHKGNDLMAARGSQVVSSVDGVVTAVDYDNLGGNYVMVKDSRGYKYYYAHLDKFSSNIQVGSKVRAGTFLGTVGNTGNARTTAPHLHYEIRLPNGKSIDPYSTLRSTSSRTRHGH